MNSERLAILADRIEDDADHFDMGQWFRFPNGKSAQTVGEMVGAEFSCGTTACVAGWAIHLWPAEASDMGGFGLSAQRILGLSDDQAELFMETEMPVERVAEQLRSWAGGDPTCWWVEERRDEDDEYDEDA